MNNQCFEHPLNEKSRIYLRVEALLNQLKASAPMTEHYHHLLFFRSIFDLLEIFDQTQIKTELAKDLDRQRGAYRHWLHIEDVDQEKLQRILEQHNQAHHLLMTGERLGQSLREDKFLASIRQRFNLPGGTCSFDLPALHHWTQLPIALKQQATTQWIDTLKPINDGLGIWLNLVRETGHFNNQEAENGFFQSDIDQANILRLNVPVYYGVYPMISGHKTRFAIKFVNFDNSLASTEHILFKLAICT